MKLIYIAGPFRGPSSWDIQKNVMSAMEQAWRVWALGHAAVCPHANTMFFQGSLADDIWLKGDLEIISRCDAMLMAPHWEGSVGSQVEHNFAITKNIPVFYNLSDLDQWLCDQT
jgi:hypothetical protein